MTILELRDLYSTINGNEVLSGASCSFEAGKIHAILGERRSGKSAIAFLLSGLAKISKGSLYYNNKDYAKLRRFQSQKPDIGIFFQDTAIIPSLNSYENVLAGRGQLGLYKAAQLDEAKAWLDKLSRQWNSSFNYKTRTRYLGQREQSIVELARCLAFNPLILVLDEPAGRFTADELVELYSLLKECKESNIAVVYIATNVNEVFQIADQVSVMRHGKIVDTRDVKALDRHRLIDLAYSFSETREELLLKNIELLKYSRYSEELVMNLPVGAIIIDENKAPYLINQQAGKLLGMGSDESFKGQRGFEKLEATILEPVKSELIQAIQEGKKRSWDKSFTIDGKILNILTFPFHDSSSLLLGTIIVLDDITQSILTQEYLVRAERASSIAELAAGVAHEVNNPLAIISNYVELLIMKKQGAYTSDRLEIIRDEIKRIQTIVTSLLSFSAIGISGLEILDLAELIDASIMLLSHEAQRRAIELDKEIAIAPLMAKIDPAKIKQVIINLVINAMEAMEKGGKIVIRLLTPDQDKADTVKLEIEDNGPGIPQEVMNRIFEPFIQGKKKKNHSGLGLSVSKHIVDSHSGTISCESKPGKTRFTIELPTGIVP
ncbi:hypothetical protein MASR2M29_10220 [Spirochaetota bacterium]